MDTSKYCRYHRGEGHTTDECITLKDEIENLIRQGRLPSRFIKKDGNKRARDDKNAWDKKKSRGGCADDDEKKGDRRTPPRDNRPTGIIHMISGGIEKSGAKTPHKRRKVNRSILRIDYKEASTEERWVEPIVGKSPCM